MGDQDKSRDPRPVLVGGLKHIAAATRYSMAGLRCLLDETAFVLEVCGAAGLFVLFWIVGATATQFIALALLALLTLCVEALNTAIELIVDEISPQRSEFARKAKDIGSFAVFCMLSATGLYACHVLAGIYIWGI